MIFAGFSYNMSQYDKILYIVLWVTQDKLNLNFNLQTVSRSSLAWASYGMNIVRDYFWKTCTFDNILMG